MFFELTDKLSDCIIFSMEDQTCAHLVDAESGVVIDVTDEIVEDNDRYYGLPEWTSKDGYSLLEDFTAGLYQPQVKDKLRNVLISGRGVFRNYKNVLKEYPEIERKWHFFKDSRMRRRLMEWYNDLRTVWGLEELEISDADDLSDLVQDDFVFSIFNSSEHRDDVERELQAVTEECTKHFNGELGDSIAAIWLRDSQYFDMADKLGYVCHSQSDSFTGCALFSLCPTRAKKTVALTDFFVLQDFRGLGIGKELFSNSLTLLKNQGIQWVLVSNIIIPKPLEIILKENGFEQIGTGFVVELSKE